LLLASTVVALPSVASCRAELLLGMGMAAVACSSLILFGVLSGRVHLAWHRGAAPWRVRVGELLGLVGGLGVIGSGIWCLATLELSPAGMIVGGLLVTSLAFASFCLGLCSTLSKVS
jgi:hypothetical protein